MTSEPSPLDNAVWHSLTTRHARFAESAGDARRYRPDVSVFAALGDLGDSAWGDLATLVGPGGHAVLFRDELPEPAAGWTHLGGGVGHQMVLGELAPVPVPSARPLGADDVGRDAGPGRGDAPRPVLGPHRRAGPLLRRVRR